MSSWNIPEVFSSMHVLCLTWAQDKGTCHFLFRFFGMEIGAANLNYKQGYFTSIQWIQTNLALGWGRVLPFLAWVLLKCALWYKIWMNRVSLHRLIAPLSRNLLAAHLFQVLRTLLQAWDIFCGKKIFPSLELFNSADLGPVLWETSSAEDLLFINKHNQFII